MQFAMPPAVSAITAIVTDVDQHERSPCSEEIVDMADFRQVWTQIPDPRDHYNLDNRPEPRFFLVTQISMKPWSSAVAS
ncbi:hypothetical protein [Nonomuraea sp. CA-141351]|uniref:hypothetical protein n=1 Tax=Nonomuraea sp. CA-141351 TaxID=3239996 RepID=UPI003D8B709D